jgi:hypothetical protein
MPHRSTQILGQIWDSAMGAQIAGQIRMKRATKMSLVLRPLAHARVTLRTLPDPPCCVAQIWSTTQCMPTQIKGAALR